MLALLLSLFAFAALGFLYVRRNDAALSTLPPDAAAFSPLRMTPALARLAEKQAPLSVVDHLPPKTGRRYIVVGGVSVVVRKFIGL